MMFLRNGTGVKFAGVVIIICAILGVYGWISATGANPDRYMQVLAVLAPTIGALVTMAQVQQARHQTEEIKEIVSPVENHTERARLAYQAYGDAVGWKNYRGERMPAFEELNADQTSGWLAASKAVNGETVV